MKITNSRFVNFYLFFINNLKWNEIMLYCLGLHLWRSKFLFLPNWLSPNVLTQPIIHLFMPDIITYTLQDINTKYPIFTASYYSPRRNISFSGRPHKPDNSSIYFLFFQLIGRAGVFGSPVSLRLEIQNKILLIYYYV